MGGFKFAGARFERSACGSAVSVRPNVRINRRAAAGRLGPVGENVPRTADRAKVACRSASG